MSKPLTKGLHQRSDDSYFDVCYYKAEPGIKPGWYWTDTDEEGMWLGEWISGPYPTVEEAAQAGWYEERQL